MKLTTPGDKTQRSVGGKLSDLEVSEPDVAPVILQQEMTFHPVAEAGDILEFAFSDSRLDRRAAALVLEHFGAIEPMLDVISADDNARLVDLAHRSGGWA